MANFLLSSRIFLHIFFRRIKKFFSLPLSFWLISGRLNAKVERVKHSRGVAVTRWKCWRWEKLFVKISHSTNFICPLATPHVHLIRRFWHIAAQTHLSYRSSFKIVCDIRIVYLLNCGSISFDIFKHDSTHPRLVFLICARSSGQSCFSCPMWINISRNDATWVLISINIWKRDERYRMDM